MAWDSDALKKSLLIGAGSGLVIGIGSVIPVVNWACCCIGWALWAVVGGSYGFMSQRGGKAVDVGTWALGGAAVAAAGVVVRDIVNVIGTVLLNLLGFAALSSPGFLRQLGLDPSEYGLSASDFGSGMGGAVVGACVYGIITLVIAVVMGAVGGLVWGLIRQGSSSTPTAPAQPAV